MNLEEFIALAVEEDIGDGDHTSLACIPESALEKAELLVKEAGVLAGVELAEKIFRYIDPDLEVTFIKKDGDKIKPGDKVLEVSGKAQSILKAERLVLNCMQRMSGIATYTNRIAEQLSGLKAKVLDTRKTTPGVRMIEKWAVRIGGGYNHRFGLYDMIMIKDNHVDFAGGIRPAIEAANNYITANKRKLPIEIEARNLQELKEIIDVGKIHRVLLDNFSPEDTKKAIALIGGKFESESSGNINESNILKYAACGVDFISVGALTHSVKSLDLSLKAVK